MKKSKALVSQALATLKENIRRTGDPLGFTRDYWSGWAADLGLPKGGDTIIYTGRMYQMLPYVIQTTSMVPMVKPFLELPGVPSLIRAGNNMVGEPIIRMKARGESDIRKRGEQVLNGVVLALTSSGVFPGYLYGEEPYSGVLLHDLGLDAQVLEHVQNVYQIFVRNGVKNIITLDPHTTFMLKRVFPELLPEFDLNIRHYTEILVEKNMANLPFSSNNLPSEFVIHDSCVMSRDLEIITPIRTLAHRLELNIAEPENSGKNTGCCGGPVEYAFGDLCHKISRIRMEELAQMGKDIIVACPICLINLRQYESEMGVKVWDIGEILYQALQTVHA